MTRQIVVTAVTITALVGTALTGSAQSVEKAKRFRAPSREAQATARSGVPHEADSRELTESAAPRFHASSRVEELGGLSWSESTPQLEDLGGYSWNENAGQIEELGIAVPNFQIARQRCCR